MLHALTIQETTRKLTGCSRDFASNTRLQVGKDWSQWVYRWEAMR